MKTGAAGGMPVRANAQHWAPRTASAWGALATVFNITYAPRWREPPTAVSRREPFPALLSLPFVKPLKLLAHRGKLEPHLPQREVERITGVSACDASWGLVLGTAPGTAEALRSRDSTSKRAANIERWVGSLSRCSPRPLPARWALISFPFYRCGT